ncbi:sporulation histidine kinase inhibitor Sda [Bhargavaea massiliensis]|uniref:sporulation histidine kinase inhibitor Sda n=1 Tax=Bhargavaea massiliensis TaxID=2697500 RepID=UPI00301356B4
MNKLDRLTDDQLIDTYLTAIAHGLNPCFIMLLEREIMRRTFDQEKKLLCPA